MADQGDAQGTPEQAPQGAPSEPTGPADAAVSRDPGTPDTAVDDANDMRGFFYRQRMRRRSTWIWGGLVMVLGGIGAAFISPVAIPVGILAGLLIVMLFVF